MSTASASRGGHTVVSKPMTCSPEPMRPVACWVHSASKSSPGRVKKRSSRWLFSSAAPTEICICTAPVEGSASGVAIVSSSTRSQPAWSAARTASSRKPVPGKKIMPPTLWSASHGWVASDRVPVSRSSSEPATDIAAPSSGWSAEARPRPVASTAVAVALGQ